MKSSSKRRSANIETIDCNSRNQANVISHFITTCIVLWLVIVITASENPQFFQLSLLSNLLSKLTLFLPWSFLLGLNFTTLIDFELYICRPPTSQLATRTSIHREGDDFCLTREDVAATKETDRNWVSLFEAEGKIPGLGWILLLGVGIRGKLLFTDDESFRKLLNRKLHTLTCLQNLSPNAYFSSLVLLCNKQWAWCTFIGNIHLYSF